MDFLKEEKIILKNSVHAILAHSYAAYFIAFLLGLFIHFIFPVKIYDEKITTPVGLVFLIVATFIIFWAQKTSRNLDITNLSKETFCKGPYCYTRTPTQFGLFILVIGFGLIINSLSTVLLTLLSFIVSQSVFIKKQEAILLKKYGSHYLEYKKSVKF